MEIFTGEELILIREIQLQNDRILGYQRDLKVIECRIQDRLNELKINADTYNAKIKEQETEMIAAKEKLLKSLWNCILARDPNQTPIDEPIVNQILSPEQIGRTE